VANLVDVILDAETDMVGNSESARKALTEAVTATAVDDSTQPETETEQSTNDSWMPAKFKGKGVKEIVEAYQNLESRAGSMANDLGVQRQLTDRLLGLKREEDLRANGGNKERAKPAPVTTNDLLDRPQETLERVVNDGVQAVREDSDARIRNLEAQLAQTKFEQRHPDFQSTVQDPAFLDWIKASKLRVKVANAANAGNWELADDLFTEYKATQGTNRRQETRQETRRDTKQDDTNLDEARRASYTSSGNASGTDGQAKPGKIYKRSDLIRLRIEDPDSYYDESFQEEILKAHAEKRVK